MRWTRPIATSRMRSSAFDNQGKLLVEQKPGRARPRGGAESADCLQAMIEHSQLIIEQIER
ncbi:hypothetical protein [Caballeronia zhejiangensis]|uniref:hypothetical protein n=1 Tax=Caballeronia zhejiangensis TaxID=871203 RepID=UPI0005593043|nr:hypothetical protein [Caballeronia zhejiangensis]